MAWSPAVPCVACGSVRLPLNISEDRNTAIARSLSSYRGSGVHHIAFDCADIFAAVAQAKEAGVALLEIPLNYYDDLAARFDFDDEFLSELAYYNVLYDRDAQGGELFHVFTEPFEERFFFEILQRRHGYAGYGAANVPVRLAAMAQARRVCAGPSCENCRGSGRCSSYSRAGPA